jgi:UDP-N-acetylmuramoyl-tripeptide--D-alanyl-D-alanine ligase
VINLKIKDLAQLLNAEQVESDASFEGVATDSRGILPGQLFITWEGDVFDGHQFCKQAEEKGAAAVLVEKRVDVAIPQIIVKDSIKALGTLAKHWRDQFQMPFIAVTGSNGKTTVKNMIASIFACAYGENYLAPKKSFNNHTGVPLTLSSLNQKQKAAIIEMGMNHFGELSYLTSIVQPNVAMITNALRSHMAGVGGTVEGVAKAKAEIFEGLQENGTAVLNADDPAFDFWRNLLKDKEVLTFGLEGVADFTAHNIKVTPRGIQYDLKTPKESIQVSSCLLGKHNIMNGLAAAAATFAMGLNAQTIAEGLSNVLPEPRRLNLKRTKAGGVLIDDSYNANPASTKKAIDVLSQFEGEKILVLGDMKELGQDEKSLHKEVGEYAKAQGIQKLWAFGDLMQEAVNGFGEGAKHFATKDELKMFLKSHDEKGRIFLMKGSNSQKMNEEVLLLQEEE